MKKVGKNLRTHKIITKSSLIISLLCLFVISILSFENIVTSIRGLKKIQSIVENKLNDLSEALEFQNGSFSIKIPHYDKVFIVEANLRQNQSTEISFTEEAPYSMKGFTANVYRTKDIKENWEDMLEISSDIAQVEMGSFKISENVNAKYSSNKNKNFNKTILFAKWVKILKNGNLQGEELFINGNQGVFTAQKFVFLKSSGFGQFEGEVMMENENYKIKSRKLDAYFFDGSVQSMYFKQNVVFTQKTGERTVVYGDNARYDAKKSEIYIYGNVSAYSSKNNTKIKGQSFTYNEKTKIGNLQGSRKSNSVVSIELEI